MLTTVNSKFSAQNNSIQLIRGLETLEFDVISLFLPKEYTDTISGPLPVYPGDYNLPQDQELIHLNMATLRTLTTTTQTFVKLFPPLPMESSSMTTSQLRTASVYLMDSSFLLIRIVISKCTTFVHQLDLVGSCFGTEISY
jgi:hypothetical protein